MPGYYTNDKGKCPDDYRFAGKEKFPPKVLVRIANPLAECPRHSYVLQFNYQIYVSDVSELELQLLPFIREHHLYLDYMFWLDLASSH